MLGIVGMTRVGVETMSRVHGDTGTRSRDDSGMDGLFAGDAGLECLGFSTGGSLIRTDVTFVLVYCGLH
jgi:hypothetical protein